MYKFKNIIAWFKKDRKRIVVLGIVLVVVFLFLRGRNQNTKPQYQTATVEKGTIVATVAASGKVNTANVMDITTQATGVVRKVYVKDGVKVYKGQKLADIALDQSGQQKNSQAWASYLAAKNSLDAANTNLYTLQAQSFAANSKLINDAVARNLATNDPTYIQENATWLAAQASYNNQQNVISQSRAALTSAWYTYQQTSSSITAPQAGIFFNTGLVEGLTVGSNTSSSSKLGTIQNTANPILSFNLAEIDVPNVKVGLKATITFDSLSAQAGIPDKTYTGKVVAVDKTGTILNNVTSYPAIIVLDTTSDQILPNMDANANIITNTKNDVLLVPSGAVQTQNGAVTVRVLKNGQPETIDVTTGLSSETQTEIVSGLSEGDVVVTGVVTAASGARTTSIFSGGFGGGAFRSGTTSTVRRGN